MNRLREQVEQSIRARGLLRRGQAVLVAVSGGVDSMVLLHVLHELARDQGWRLTVAHLNHRLRGRSSDADERLVVRTARRLGLPAVVERADVQKLARAQKLSTEMAARKVRHDFLARTAARLKIRAIALAHHADDQVELFFLRLFRGSGNEGLAGMKWRSPPPGEVRSPAFGRRRCKIAPDRLKAELQTQLIRPLLDQSKASLEEYARANKIPFREDATNASLDMQRNRIRHELLPLLRRRYQPALDRAVLRLMEIAGAEAEFSGRAAADWLKAGDRVPFGKLPVAVQRRCIQLQLISGKVAADFELIERLRAAPGCPFSVAAHQTVALDAAGEIQLHEIPPAMPEATPVEVKLKGRAGTIVFNNLQIRWQAGGHIGSLRSKRATGMSLGREVFDADKVGKTVLLRLWRAGDRFQPSGMSSPVKLQDLFVNQKIARARRHQLAVATTAAGELFWVEQLRIAERFKLGKGTIRRLLWRWNTL